MAGRESTSSGHYLQSSRGDEEQRIDLKIDEKSDDEQSEDVRQSWKVEECAREQNCSQGTALPSLSTSLDSSSRSSKVMSEDSYSD
eukprot:216038-Hanusia_phi.AAC.1